MPADKFNIGGSLENFTIGDRYEKFSKVIINIDDNNYYEAGDDSGETLEFTNPWGTQQMANNILASLGDYAYQPYDANGVNINPAAEIGDGVTFKGVYGGLYNQDIKFGTLMKSDLSATGDNEIDHEYPYVTKDNKEIVRKIASTAASLQVGVDTVSAEVSKKVNASGGTSTFGWTLTSDSWTINSNGSNVLVVNKDGLTVYGNGNFTGIVHAENISDSTGTAWAPTILTAGSVSGGDGGCIGSGTVSYGNTSFTGTLDQVGTNASNISSMWGYFTGSASFTALKVSGGMFLGSRQLSTTTLSVVDGNKKTLSLKVVTWADSD